MIPKNYGSFTNALILIHPLDFLPFNIDNTYDSNNNDEYSYFFSSVFIINISEVLIFLIL